MTDERISVMVVDDHPLWRDGVARDLSERGFRVAATAGDTESAVRIARTVRPDVVLMDLNLGTGSGVTAILGIVGDLPATRVLVLSASGAHEDVLEAVKAGASGYLVKSASVEELVDAVRRTASGDAVFTAGLAGLVLGEFRRMSKAPDDGVRTPALTERETDVLRLVAKGLSAPADRGAPGDLAPDGREPRAVDTTETAVAQSGGVGPLRHRTRAGWRGRGLSCQQARVALTCPDPTYPQGLIHSPLSYPQLRRNYPIRGLTGIGLKRAVAPRVKAGVCPRAAEVKMILVAGFALLVRTWVVP
jgi:DNA-binding NarL/FixJ family response regulator